MQLSLRALLLYMAFTSACLALTQAEFITGSTILAGAVIAAWTILLVRTWRYVVYGAILGMIGGITVLWTWTWFQTGVVVASNYQESHDQLRVALPLRPYAIQLGAWFGASLGIALSAQRAGPVRENSVN